jgi:hypothetical protein
LNEASRWRLDLARRIAPVYAEIPGVRAVAGLGSVARGWADRYSDVEFGVFWQEPPSDEARRLAAERAGGTERRSPPLNERIRAWEEEYYVHGVKIDLGHFTLAAVEGILSDVLERHDPSTPGQNTLAALQDALPLHGEDLLQKWRARAGDYPPALARAMVEAHLRRSPLWFAAMHSERDDFILFRYNLSVLSRELLLVLLGLNRVYDPGHKWVHRLIDRLAIAPADFGPHLRALLHAEPRAAIEPLQALVDEVFALVELHMPEVDTAAARARFHESPHAWDEPPAGLFPG